MTVSYLTPKARPVAVGAAGRGAMAVEPIGVGEVIAAFGGRCLTRDEFDLLPVAQRVRSIQIEETLFLAGSVEPEPADFINHSCDPNCGMSGSTILVALPVKVAPVFKLAASAASTIAKGPVGGPTYSNPPPTTSVLPTLTTSVTAPSGTHMGMGVFSSGACPRATDTVMAEISVTARMAFSSDVVLISITLFWRYGTTSTISFDGALAPDALAERTRK